MVIFFSGVCGVFDPVAVFAADPPSSSQTFPTAQVLRILSDDDIELQSISPDWQVGDWIHFLMADGTASTLSIESISKSVSENVFTLGARPVSLSAKRILVLGQVGKKIDVAHSNSNFLGRTELLLKRNLRRDQVVIPQAISSRYKPLVYQGLVMGDTAETLWESEYLATVYGQVMYGISNRVTVGSLMTALPIAPNLQFKVKVFEGTSQMASVGLNYIKVVDSDQTSVNLNVYWDSFNNESLISHTFLSVAVATWKSALDATALKGAGTSSFQTGYEFVLDSWNRVLLGPSYNFERKAIGGFISHLWVWDHFHLSLGVSATDITKLKVEPKEGYLPSLELYWRF